MTLGFVIAVILVLVALVLLSQGLRIVPQQHSWVVERLGRFTGVLEPGLNLLIPIIDTVPYKFDTREQPIDVVKQVCITKDNTQVSIDGVLYVQITDAQRAAYGTTNPLLAVTQLAQTVMRAQVGKKQLDECLSSREEMNQEILSQLDEASHNWGIKVLRYEIRDITPPAQVQKAMELQITAEREKRATILNSEAAKEQAINVSQGDMQQRINLAEAARQERVLAAKGESEAIAMVATATAKALETVGKALNSEGGQQAMQLDVAKDYIAKFGETAKAGTTILLPANMGDMGGTVAGVLGIMNGMKGGKHADVVPASGPWPLRESRTRASTGE